MLAQESAGVENHPGLAKAALRDVFFDPGALAGMARVGREAFDGGKRTLGRLPRRDLTGTERFAVFQDGAGAADADPTFVPVMPNESRKIQSNGVSSSTSTSRGRPLMVRWSALIGRR